MKPIVQNPNSLMGPLKNNDYSYYSIPSAVKRRDPATIHTYPMQSFMSYDTALVCEHLDKDNYNYALYGVFVVLYRQIIKKYQ